MPRSAKTLAQLKNENSDYSKQRSKAYERKRMSEPRLRVAKNFRNSTRWKKFRDWFKNKYPLCCDPFGTHKQFGHVQITEQIHHIVPLVEDMDLGLVESNCAPVCNSCHGKLEGMYRSGRTTKHLFNRK